MMPLPLLCFVTRSLDDWNWLVAAVHLDEMREPSDEGSASADTT